MSKQKVAECFDCLSDGVYAVIPCPLHAAAPALLVALKKLSRLAEHHTGVFKIDWLVGEAYLTEGFCDAIEAARAAIAQAEGN